MNDVVNQYFSKIKLKDFEHHEMFISFFSPEEYQLAINSIKEWIIEGLDNHISSESSEDLINLIPSSFIFSAWILTRILKSGQNDPSFNQRQVKLILKSTKLIDKVFLKSYSEFIFTGLGMCITQINKQLNLTNDQSCRLIISTCLIVTEQIIEQERSYAA